MMMVTVLAPELYNFVAISQYLDAKVTLRDLKELTPSLTPAEGWTLAHALFANMGGFRIPVQNPPTPFYAKMMGLAVPDWPSLVVLTGESFTKLLKLQDLAPHRDGDSTKTMPSTGNDKNFVAEVEQSSSTGRLPRNHENVAREDHQSFKPTLPTEADIQDKSTSDLFANRSY
jgi:hypothetical protein